MATRHEEEKEDKGNQTMRAFASCVIYTFISLSMTLTNKYLLAVYEFGYPNVLVLWQNAIAVVLLLVARQGGLLEFKNPDRQTIVRWLPVNVLFVVMLSTAAAALQYLPVPMVSIFKNISVVLTALGDLAFNGQLISRGIAFTLVLMVLSSIASGLTDLSFNLKGYLWMTANVVATVSYLLYLRYVQAKIKLTSSAMSFLNNLLSVPFFIILAFIGQEVHPALESPVWGNVWFRAMFLFSALVGFSISLCSFWCFSLTSPTTYSIVGALNKVLLMLLGFTLFSVPTSVANVISVGTGVAAGILYTYVKKKEEPAEKPDPGPSPDVPRPSTPADNNA